MATNGDADILFVNGAVYTVDAARTWAQAVGVKDGRIVAVGTTDAVAGLRGSRTEVIDLAGRMLLPGFQDAHVHPVSGGIDMLQCDLHDLDTKDAYLAAIAEYARSHPDEAWITGGGWSQEVFPRGCPGKEDLDAIVPDRPILLPNRDGHSGWVNSKALEIAAITAETPDPEDGRIERRADGSPQGTLHEGAQHLVTQHMPSLDATALDDGLRKGQTYLHSFGLTAWQDAIVQRGATNNYDAYLRAGTSGGPPQPAARCWAARPSTPSSGAFTSARKICASMRLTRKTETWCGEATSSQG